MINKNPKFNLACIKLTLFYVMIIMIISVGFSIGMYKISANEIGKGLGRQTRIFGQMPGNNLDDRLQQLEQARLKQLNESNNHLQINFVYFNLLILILSSIASYFFARRTLEPIEEAVESQNRFTADASHELRTPLTAMKTEIEVALRDKKMSISEAKTLLGSNLEEIEKLESLANALLKLTRYQENFDACFETISLEETITEAYEKVEPLAKKKSIIFENNLLDISILGDKHALRELFVILLDNAIKYSEIGQKIHIEMRKDGNHAIIQIKDHGIGIKESDLPYIFNRFYRADSSRTKECVAGYGLGLSIAKRIVELHKGSISAVSQIGKGTTFTIRF